MFFIIESSKRLLAALSDVWVSLCIRELIGRQEEREHHYMLLPHMVARGKFGSIPASANTAMTNNNHINEN